MGRVDKNSSDSGSYEEDELNLSTYPSGIYGVAYRLKVWLQHLVFGCPIKLVLCIRTFVSTDEVELRCISFRREWTEPHSRYLLESGEYRVNLSLNKMEKI